MHKDTLLEIAPHAVQICTPLLSAVAEHHYTKKELEMKKEFEVEKAERKAQGLQQLGGGPQPQQAQQAPQAGAGQHAESQVGQEPSQQPGDVYERLRRLRERAECGFCRDVATGLLEEDEQTAQAGERELRQYLDKWESLRAANASQDKVEQEMEQLTDEWEVVPDVYLEVA